jgi:2-iminobutanoate/2-iminopropanoate deaminase
MGTAVEAGEFPQVTFATADATVLRRIVQAGIGLLAAASITGCVSGADPGGRSFVYRSGPGDPPSTIHSKAGVVYKVREAAPEAEPARATQTQTARADVPAPMATPVAPAPAAPAPAAPPAPAPAAVSPPAVAPTAPAPVAAAPAAAAVGSSVLDARYTQASRYGDLLFLSGQIAIDLTTGEPAADLSVDAQTRKVMENIQRILEAQGLTMANVLSTQVYLRSINNLSLMDSVYRKFFKGAPPARTIVEVSNLPRGMEVQISAVAGK